MVNANFAKALVTIAGDTAIRNVVYFAVDDRPTFIKHATDVINEQYTVFEISTAGPKFGHIRGIEMQWCGA